MFRIKRRRSIADYTAVEMYKDALSAYKEVIIAENDIISVYKKLYEHEKGCHVRCQMCCDDYLDEIADLENKLVAFRKKNIPIDDDL